MRENFNLNNEKGSITVFVLVALLFMSAFLIISYASNVNKSKIAKEQLDIIKDIYKGNENVVDSYQEVYTSLRNKNKKELTKSMNNIKKIELNNAFKDKVSNYKIYGNNNGLGDLITNESDPNFNKYIISIKITDIDDEAIIDDSQTYQIKTYNIILDEPLLEDDYVHYISKKLVRSDSTEENIELPELYTFEDYTKIEFLTQVAPSKVEISYTGYNI